MSISRERYLKNLNHPLKMQAYFLTKLPTLWFWGVRIQSITPERGQTRIPFGWRTQNPFRSTYFAALAGAAELSTGMLGLLALTGQVPCSMLITNMEAKFIKKATNWVTFTCEDGAAIQEAVNQAIQSGAAQSITAKAVGIQDDTGAVVAEMWFTWSFKRK